jgi:acetyltransferase-like isoleucine patch superfamily enzyme
MKKANLILGEGIIQEEVLLGVLPRTYDKCITTILGENYTLRSGTIIYGGVNIGDNFQTGHNVLIRENTSIGDNVLIGTNSIIENECNLGNHLSIQSNVYIPTNTSIDDLVFIGPNVTMTNDMYPIRSNYELSGPKIGKSVSIGAGSVLLPDVKIGDGSFIAAGSVVTKDVPPYCLAKGSPCKFYDLPEKLDGVNNI